MAALQCEICGGKLMGKPGGIFECDSCGMEYSTAWAKEKIQEIKGTVKVEGTVEVQGTVKVDGPIEVKGGINIESLLKRGQLALADQNWKDADQHFDEALNYDPECAEAYLGKLMAELCVRTRDGLKNCSKPFDSKSNYQKAVRFASKELKEIISEYAKQCSEKCENEKKRKKYSSAKYYMSCAKMSGDYQDVAEDFKSISGYMDADDRAKECLEKAKELKNKEELVRRQNVQRIAAGEKHTVGLCSDGKVLFAGADRDEQSRIRKLRDIVAVFAGGTKTVALHLNNYVGDDLYSENSLKKIKEIVFLGEKVGFFDEFYTTDSISLLKDGTICGDILKKKKYESVSEWRDIISIAAGVSLLKDEFHIVGLRRNGTVVAVGNNKYDQCNVAGWKNITAIAAGCMHTVGLCSNGTTVTVGSNCYGQRKNLSYKKVVAISAGKYHTVGLCADGTVAATGSNEHGQCNVSEWRDIIAIAAGDFHTVGLKRDGTVVAVGNNAHWQCNVEDWQLYSKEELAAQKLPELETKKAALESERVELPEEQAKLQAELPTLKGLFSGGRRKEVEARLVEIPNRIAEIDSELAKIEQELAALG